MVQKLNPTPSLPFPTNDAMQWANALVPALIRELSAYAVRSNNLLAGDGTETATAPVLLAQYAKAALPTAASYTGGIIYVTDGTSNKRLAVSDGTNWRFPDGNIVS